MQLHSRPLASSGYCKYTRILDGTVSLCVLTGGSVYKNFVKLGVVYMLCVQESLAKGLHQFDTTIRLITTIGYDCWFMRTCKLLKLVPPSFTNLVYYN